MFRARHLSTLTALAGVVLLTGLAGAPGLAAAASPSAAGQPTQVLSTDVLPGLSGLGSTPTPANTPVEVGITLANPNAAAQNALWTEIYTKGSPEYHHFLTPAQVAQDFGGPAATFAPLLSWATRDGLRPAYLANTREYLMLQGTVGQAERTFSVSIRTFTRKGSTFFANSNGPTVPAGLDVAGVIGLNNLLRSHTFNHRPPSSAPHGPTPSQGICAGSECVGLTTPQDLWSIYGQPTNLSDATQDFGQGQQMGVLGEGAVSSVVTDLRAFEKEFSLPQIPITIHSVGDDFQDTSGSGEWDIDSQATTGMAPKAFGETWYFAKDLTDASVLGDIQAFQGDTSGPMQANASFGECEEDPTSPVTQGGAGTGLGGLAGTAGVEFTTESNNALQQANLEGKTLFASTGDTGSSCPVVFAAVIGAGNGVANQGYPETNYPASSPYVTAVGGTVLYGTQNTATPPASNSTRAQETSWTFTGGGNTFYIPEPAYQKGITLLDTQDCVSQPNGTPYASPTPCRGIPDVAAQSGDVASNGYAVTMGGTADSQGAGTSLSSPLWVGMWTRIQAAAKTQTNGMNTLGFANPVLYTIGQNPTQDAADFFDLGGGASSPPTSDGYYTNLPRSPADPPGWDYLSGLGSPNVTALGKDATGNTSFTPTNTTAAPAAQDCGQPGLNPCSTGGTGATCSVTSGLWTNPPHTASDTFGNSDPQLSLLAGAMSVTADNSELRAFLTVTNLQESVPTGAGAAQWYALWTYGATTYFADATLSAVPGSTPTYGDGTVTTTGGAHQFNQSANTNDTGHFTLGPNGVVEIDVPLANIGNPPLGSVLSLPSGETYIEVGSSQVGGALEKVDSGGPVCDYTLGGVPSAIAPEAPVAVLVPVAGLAVVGGLLLVRRRRAHRAG